MGEDDGEDAGEGRARGETCGGVVVNEAGEVSDREAVEACSGSAGVFAWLGEGKANEEEIRSAWRRPSVIGSGLTVGVKKAVCMLTSVRSASTAAPKVLSPSPPIPSYSPLSPIAPRT